MVFSYCTNRAKERGLVSIRAELIRDTNWHTHILWIREEQSIQSFYSITAAEASREKPRRSNSCISEGGQSCISSSFSSSGGGGGVGVVAAGGSGTILLPQAGGSSQGARRPSRAFLIQQRDSGEETLVTLTPVVGGRLVNHNHPTTSQVPTIVGPPTAQNLKSKGSMSSIGKSPLYL